MENLRNFGVQNRSGIITTIYIVAVLILVWYLIRFYFAGRNMDRTLLGAKVIADRSRSYTIADVGEGQLQMKTGSEYTLSMWLYVKNWDIKTTKVFEVFENGTTTAKMVGGFYPNEPKMYIRSLEPSAASSLSPSPANIVPNFDTLPDCDIVDVAVQRWTHVTVSVNGRIMDVYLDGKLARSCVLPNVQMFGLNNQQMIKMYTFDGFYSGIHYQAYAATPDEIYSMYASGPYAATGFLDFLMEKIGIKVEYAS